MSTLRLEGVTKRFGPVTALDKVSLEIRDGEFFAVLGPPGAGKTTLLRTIVGLETPEEGEIYADDERITDVYPGDRDIAIMFQNLALYPDKTVAGNLGFPLKQRKLPKAEIDARVRQTAETLRITHLLDRKPAKLSGGERQRVALGRTLVRDPRALLLDEPLSALDALLRLEMRAELKRLQAELGRTLVYVTHDQVEAMSMPDRVAVLRHGAVQQVDTPEAVYHQPANTFVATVIGSPPMNFIECNAIAGDGALWFEHPSFRIRVKAPLTEAFENGARVEFGVRPEDVSLAADGIRSTVFVTEPLGGETVVDLALGDQIVKALVAPAEAPDPDEAVGVRFDPARLHLFDGSGRAILSAAGEQGIFEVEPR
jgi:multiple sugar transport system ATP-binding protein